MLSTTNTFPISLFMIGYLLFNPDLNYEQWKALTRPAHQVSPDGLRRPLWLKRPLKPVVEVLDSEPLCTPRVLELLQWMSRYYLAPLGQVIEAAIPAGVRASAGSLLIIGS